MPNTRQTAVFFLLNFAAILLSSFFLIKGIFFIPEIRVSSFAITGGLLTWMIQFIFNTLFFKYVFTSERFFKPMAVAARITGLTILLTGLITFVGNLFL